MLFQTSAEHSHRRMEIASAKMNEAEGEQYLREPEPVPDGLAVPRFGDRPAPSRTENPSRSWSVSRAIGVLVPPD
jgi:hypothetical protein